MDKVLHTFLSKQQEAGVMLAAQSDILQLHPLDGPPAQHYLAQFHARGLVQDEQGRIVETEGCAFGIWLPDDYLRRVEPGQVLTYLGPQRPWHPNIRPPYVCVHLVPGMPLVNVLHTCLELWTWNLFYTGDEGLNHAAAQWARHQDPARFPLDRRPMKRRNLAISVSPAGAAEQEGY